MRITIDTHAATPAEMGILIATLVACGASVPDVAKAVSAAPVDIGGMAGVKDFTDAELTARVKLLNDELYSRRIPAADNPENGADAASLNSDASGFTKEELTAKFNNEIVNPLLAPMVAVVEKLDLADVFGGAGSGQSERVDLCVDKETADAVNANPQGAVDALAKGAQEMLGTVTLDKAGIPWDSRIHSASKAINQTDGLWRQKRGVAPELVATVIAQLKQAQSVPTISPEPGVTFRATSEEIKKDEVLKKIPPPPPRKTHMFDPGAGNSERSDKFDAFGDKTGPGGAAPADTGQIDSLPRLLKFITEQKLANKINQAQVQQALISLGIEGPLPVLGSRPDLIPEMVKKLKLIGGIE